MTSNRESGYGRYDVVMEPKEAGKPAVILEFKVFDPLDDEKGLESSGVSGSKGLFAPSSEKDSKRKEKPCR